MKPTTILIILLLFSCMRGWTQNSLSGTITDKETKEPLIGASIYIPDLKKGNVTDNDGKYIITNLPAGRFLVEVRLLSYAGKVVKVEINGETKIDFELEEAHAEFNEVVVTAVSGTTEKAINPVPTITVDKLSMNQNASSNIIDAISSKPGMSQIGTGPAISKPVIRGLGYNRVVTLQNNIRQEGQQWGDEHGIEIDEFSIDRIEIIKGPGSIAYGSDAMAGVINFLSPRPAEEGKIIGSLNSTYHSNNNLLGYSLMNAGNIKDIDWLVQGSRKKAGNYSNTYDGKIYNSAFNELNLGGYVGINKKWGYTQINFSTYNLNVGLVEGERDSSGSFLKQILVGDSVLIDERATGKDLNGYHFAIPKQGISHNKISSTSNIILGKSRLAITLAGQQNQRKEFTYVTDSVANKAHVEEGIGLHFLLQTFNYDAKYMLPEMHGWETSTGVNGMYQSNKNKGEEFLIPEYNLFDIGIFAVTKKTFGKLNLSGGARYNIRTINAKELVLNAAGIPTTQPDTSNENKFDSFKTNFPAFSGSIGGSYSFTNKIIGKLNIANGFRAPNIAELASNGAHEGTFRYEIGNSKLKPEVSLQFDASILLNTTHVSFELNAFKNNINNYIFAEKLNSQLGGDSTIVDEGESLSAFKFIKGNASLSGAEVSIDIHPHPLDWLHFENAFSFVQGIQAKQPDSTRYLPFMPAPHYQSQVKAQFKKAGKVLGNPYIKLEMDYFMQQNKIYNAYGTETKTPSYTLLNAGIGSDFVNKNGTTICSLYFSAANILNVAYQNHLSRLKYAPENIATGRIGIYNMGRNFSVKLIVPFNLKK